jgi:hypothetical protein
LGTNFKHGCYIASKQPPLLPIPSATRQGGDSSPKPHNAASCSPAHALNLPLPSRLDKKQGHRQPAESKAAQMKSNGHQVQVITKDSVTHLVVLNVNKPLRDTTYVIDSLQKWYLWKATLYQEQN